MFGVSLPRAIICASALVLFSILTISGRYDTSRPRYQQNLAEAMASSLKFITVPPKAKHTATVIFMHVRLHRVPLASFFDAKFRAGIGRLWQWLEASC